MTPTQETAAALLAQGVASIPTHHADAHPGLAKRPLISEWRQYQTGLPTAADLSKWFAFDCSLAIIAGGVTCLDLDTKNAAPGWIRTWDAYLAESGLDLLFSRLVCQTTPSGGRHYVWKCPHRVRNLKLAERPGIDPENGKPKRDKLTQEVKMRAVLDENGKPRVLAVKRYSDSLVALILKAHDPKYREKSELALSGNLELSGMADDELQEQINALEQQIANMTVVTQQGAGDGTDSES